MGIKGLSRRTIVIAGLTAMGLFLAWRFVRPLSIFVVDDRFALPISAEVPEGLTSLSARECGGCHEEIYSEWARSMHAMAWTDEYFQVDFAFDGNQQICLNCHIPFTNQQENIVLGFRDRDRLDPILTPNADFDPAFRDEGVTCAVCHLKDGYIVGPFDSKKAPHAVKADPGMRSGGAVCARCHIVSGKRWDTFYRIPPCGTVAEIREAGQESDCVGCHMPAVTRAVAKGAGERRGRKHFFRGGHHPETVARSLKVDYERKPDGKKLTYEFTLTNIWAAHYLPTGTPDRHLTLEIRLLGEGNRVLEEERFTMKRYILWRPFIVDIRDTRLPYNQPRTFSYTFDPAGTPPADWLHVTVRYHLLDEKRRKRIGYENTRPIAYPIYTENIQLSGK